MFYVVKQILQFATVALDHVSVVYKGAEISATIFLLLLQIMHKLHIPTTNTYLLDSPRQ